MKKFTVHGYLLLAKREKVPHRAVDGWSGHSWGTYKMKWLVYNSDGKCVLKDGYDTFAKVMEDIGEMSKREVAHIVGDPNWRKI